MTFLNILRTHKPRYFFAIEKLITNIDNVEDSSHY